MFNIFGIIKKTLGVKEAQNQDSKPNDETESQEKLTDKIQKIPGFVNQKLGEAVTEYGIIREKMKDLSKTNYELGMKHLEKGLVSEAVFRFKMVKKFWPENYEAQYQLAYCLILQEKFDKAEEVIAELVSKNPDYEDRVMVLIKSIDNAREKNAENLS